MASGDFLARIKLALEGKNKVISGLAETQRATQKLVKTKITTTYDKEGLVTGQRIAETFKDITDKGKGATHKIGDFEKALRRVVLVAPVWMAFRAVIQGVMGTLNEGFKTWEEFDRQLIQSKAVIHDFSGTTDEAMIELESRIRSFSKESGIALSDLASSFYRFGTVGIAFSDALAGAIASAKLAKATLGDVDTISRSLAMTYRLLGDTIDSSLSPMEKQESLAGKILHLWKTNAFESNEFASSLNNFISTANIANFTADQTVATLAALGTAGVQSSRGGTLLKTAIQKLVENLDVLAPKLGLAVNPELENTFSLFMRVLEAINQLSQTKGIPVEALKSIQEIFGGVRGGQVISALNALLPELKINLEDLGKDPQKFIKGLNDRMAEVVNTVSGQLDIFRQLKAQLGEAFVKGITGADDFKNALLKINQAMEGMILVSQKVGGGFFAIAHPLQNAKLEVEKTNRELDNLYNRIIKAKNGSLELKDVFELIAELENRQKTSSADFSGIISQLKEVGTQTALNAKTQSEVGKIISDWADKNINKKEEEKNALMQLSVALQDKLDLAEKDLEIQVLQAKGANDLVIAHQKLDNIVESLVGRYNSLKDASGNLVKGISESTVKSLVLEGNFHGILRLFKEMTLTEKELTSLADRKIEIEKSITQELGKQKSNIDSQLINYEKANEIERGRIRRLMELQALTPEDLALQFRQNAFDKNIIVQFWSSFTNEGRDAVNKVIREVNNLPTLNVEAALAAKQGNGFLGVSGGQPSKPLNQIIGAQIQNITVNLPEMDAEKLADEAGKKMAEKLKSDENFQKLVANSIRNKL
jgi:TP901 family phage tail tape measure protein